MRLLMIACAAALLTCHAAAQTIVDGSGSAIDESTLKQALASTSSELRDPLSAQFRNVRLSGPNKSDVCGEINGKNALGAYVGFVPFVYDLSDKSVTIMPPPGTTPGLIKLSTMVLNLSGCTDENGKFILGE